MNRILIDSVQDKNIPKAKMLKAARTMMDSLMEGYFELSIAFVSEAQMADLNTNYRKKSGPTDVLAFPLFGGEDLISRRGKVSLCGGSLQDGPTRAQSTRNSEAILGDVVICPEYIAVSDKIEMRSSLMGSGYGAVSQRDKMKFQDAILWRLAHGILHLAGYDHIDDNDLRRMRRKEKKLLEVVQNEDWWQTGLTMNRAGSIKNPILKKSTGQIKGTGGAK